MLPLYVGRWSVMLIVTLALGIFLSIGVGAALGGDVLAFNSDRDGNRDIYILDVRLGLLTNLTRSVTDEYNPLWSPDGRRLLFVSDLETGRLFVPAVYIMEVTTRHSERIFKATLPSWSPDGRAIVYTQDNAIRLQRLSDGHTRDITARGTINYAPIWSPDGARIAYYMEKNGQTKVMISEVQGGSQALASAEGQSFLAAWSADGGQLAVVVPSETRGRWNLVAYDMRDGTRTLLAQDVKGGQSASWSPDGRWVAYVGLVRENDGHARSEIFIVDTQTGQRRQLTDHPDDEFAPLWSPDGAKIAFCRNHAISASRLVSDIYLLRLADGAVQRLTADAGRNEWPSWWPGLS